MKNIIIPFNTLCWIEKGLKDEFILLFAVLKEHNFFNTVELVY